MPWTVRSVGKPRRLAHSFPWPGERSRDRASSAGHAGRRCNRAVGPPIAGDDLHQLRVLRMSRCLGLGARLPAQRSSPGSSPRTRSSTRRGEDVRAHLADIRPAQHDVSGPRQRQGEPQFRPANAARTPRPRRRSCPLALDVALPFEASHRVNAHSAGPSAPFKYYASALTAASLVMREPEVAVDRVKFGASNDSASRSARRTPVLRPFDSKMFSNSGAAFRPGRFKPEEFSDLK